MILQAMRSFISNCIVELIDSSVLQSWTLTMLKKLKISNKIVTSALQLLIIIEQ